MVSEYLASKESMRYWALFSSVPEASIIKLLQGICRMYHRYVA
jgi:hypothetical protein